MSALHNSIPPVVFPWSNTKLLAESLKSGEICLSTALSQYAAVTREVLRIMEEFASEQTKLNLERKHKCEKMDKLIVDLTEKCQGMQQAMLYKEEKYDEKCREVERYKVICELSANAALNDDLNLSRLEENLREFVTADTELDRDDVHQEPQPSTSRQAKAQEYQHQQLLYKPVGVTNRVMSPTSSKGNFKSHTKFTTNLTSYATPIKFDEFSSLSNINPRSTEFSLRAKTIHPPSYYAGGPCKRKVLTGPALPDDEPASAEPARTVGSTQRDLKVRDKLTLVGGINVGPPRISSFVANAMPLGTQTELLGRRITPGTQKSNDRNKRMKVALVGQRNEVMSSSKNAVHQLKQKFTEKDLHRQVAGGCWTRIPSRRRKEWPF